MKLVALSKQIDSKHKQLVMQKEMLNGPWMSNDLKEKLVGDMLALMADVKTKEEELEKIVNGKCQSDKIVDNFIDLTTGGSSEDLEVNITKMEMTINEKQMIK